MKKVLLLLSLVFSTTVFAIADRNVINTETHEKGAESEDLGPERSPLNLPIIVIYDSDTHTVEVWCDNDNIMAEVFIFNDSGVLEASSRYMNVVIPIHSSGNHTIIIQGDGWYAEGSIYTSL